jgi:hypothetical protein
MLALCAGLPATLHAESLTFYIRHEYPYSIWLEFFSESRAYVWPGGGRAYNLNSWQTQTVTLSCQSNERICYGAWAYTGRGTQYHYWGVGPQRRHTCTDCCFVCNGQETREIVLGR